MRVKKKKVLNKIKSNKYYINSFIPSQIIDHTTNKTSLLFKPRIYIKMN